MAARTWRPGERRTAWLGGAVAAVFLLFWGGVFAADWATPRPYPLGDFFAIWSYGRVVTDGAAATLYDMDGLHDMQVGWGMRAIEQNPFAYPPTFALMVAPLGLLPFYEAYALTMGVSLLAYGLALCGGWRRPVMAGAALLSPSTAACLAAGQTGFLAAALLVGAARSVATRPVLAGVLLGLLTYKPQYGIMVPVALVAGGHWRCAGTAVATACGLAALTTAVLGCDIWDGWLRALPVYEALFATKTVASGIMATVLTDAQKLGAGPSLAWTAQGAATVAAAIAVWIAWRRRSSMAVPVLLAATCLATPHAFVYDLPILTAGVLLFLAQRVRVAGGLRDAEVAIVIAALAVPEVVTLKAMTAPVTTLAIGLLLAAMLRGDRPRVARPLRLCDTRADGPAPA